MAEGEPTRRGRKRNEQSRLAILDAAFELATEEGPQSFTVEGTAARAGVGKQTVYRWWPTKGDVLLEALATRADLQISTSDKGSYRKDLEAFLRDTFELLNTPGVITALQSLMAEAQLDRDLKQRFGAGFLERRQAALAEVVDRAAARGDLPSDIARDLISDVVFGVVWYRMLTMSKPFRRADIGPLVSLLAGRGPAGSK